MPSIDEKTVRHIARLARLRIGDEEARRYEGQLEKILRSMAELEALDTRGARPTAHVLGLTDVLREDEARPFAQAERLLAGAPEREGPYFKVRRVIG